MRVKPLDEMQVGVAQPGARRSQQDLAWSRLAQAYIFNDQWLVYLMQYGSFHLGILPPSSCKPL